MELTVGKIVEGKITGITNFGAFIQFDGNKTGLVHISEVALSYVKDIKDHLSVNDKVKAKILSIDENGKVSLSIKKALEEEQKKNATSRKAPAQVDFTKNTENMSFEDKMKQFMQDSDERMAALKRNMDSRRGGGSRR